MKELKIKRAIYCLIAVAAVKILTVAYSLMVTMQAISGMESYMGPNNLMSQSLLSASILFAVAEIVLIYFVIRDLKKDKAWAWVTGLCLFLYAAPSFALPAAIIGFISLIDEDVRTSFINQLDIKI